MDTKTKYVVSPNYLFPVPYFQILLRSYINNIFFLSSKYLPTEYKEFLYKNFCKMNLNLLGLSDYINIRRKHIKHFNT
jgi:hypothetical protein